MLTALSIIVPTEFTSVPFPVKALKLLLRDLQSGGEAASMGFSAKDVSEVASDDGVCCRYLLMKLRVSSSHVISGRRLD